MIRPEEIADFVLRLPVDRIHGVGPKTAEKLHKLDVQTCADLQRFEKYQLAEHFGVFGQRLYELARGNDDRDVKARTRRKSVSVERTFPKDIPTGRLPAHAARALPETGGATRTGER